jgi:hypothetical protein
LLLNLMLFLASQIISIMFTIVALMTSLRWAFQPLSHNFHKSFEGIMLLYF